MFRKFILDKIVKESSIIKSFYFKRADNEPVEDYLPGQYAIVRVKPDESQKEIIRNYTISDRPGKGYFRFTIKREDQGKISRYFHDVLNIGDIIEISKPSGDFYLTKNSPKSVALISGGVGITPMLSMLEHLTTHEPERKVFFIHTSKNKSVQTMSGRLKELKDNNQNLYLSIHHSNPNSDEILNVDSDYEGHITKEYLTSVFPKVEMDYFLCGPEGFMEVMFQLLMELGVREESIYYEFFGGGQKLGTEPVFVDSQTKGFKVNFTNSNKEVIWNQSIPSILELAESVGLMPESSCRMGTCSTCESTLIKGNVEYDPEPFMEIPEGRLLICCSQPKSDIEIEL